MTKDDIKANIHACAVYLMNNGPIDNYTGICDNMRGTPVGLGSIEYVRRLSQYFKTWDNYSGHPGYPIPDAPTYAFQRFRVKYFQAIIGNPCTLYVLTGNKWDPNSEYGGMRWDLLLHIIKETK